MFARLKRIVWRVIEAILQAPSLFESRLDWLEWRRRLGCFLQGDGIEIGALHQPLPLGATHISHIRYVDLLTLAQMRQHFPELSSYRLTAPDVIDDGEVLGYFPNGSLDFIIANHFIEHARNPIGAIKVWINKLKPGGIIWMAIPHRHYTFDVDRPLSSLEHLINDDVLPPDVRKTYDFEHYLEWSESVCKKSGEAIDQYAHQLAQSGEAIHFHTFDGTSFLRIISHIREKLLLPLDILAYVDASEKTGEFLIVLSKRK